MTRVVSRRALSLKTKNLRVVLPRDDAEGLIWKPESRWKASRATDPSILVGRKHIAEGQAVNPSQVGFHFIKRECPPIPFTPVKKNLIVSSRELSSDRPGSC